MKGIRNKIERRLRIAAASVFVGLSIQLVTLRIHHPLAFLAFIMIGSPLVFLGAVLYLWSVVSEGRST
jgi:hypothetical protein